MAKWYKYGRYYLLRHIATGGMADIFLSKQIGLEGFEKLLVIKKILNQYVENDEFIEMFLDEARLAAKLDHPNIVRIYDLGKQGTSYYIAMEYIAGEDLRSIMKKVSQKGQIIPIQHTLHVISSIAEALDYAHKKKDPSGKPLNIIHRDVSPQNVMVAYEGGVKLLDFGIAKASTQSSETEAGVLKGKYAYMSPEQAKGKKLDHRSDIFAVGILLFEMLTNHRLFKAGNQLDTLRKLVYEEIPTPQKFNPNIPESLSAIVMKALAKDVDKRYQTARELQNEIEEWLAQNQMISSPTRAAKFMQELFSEEIKNMQTLEQKIEEEQKEVLATDLPDISQDSGLFEPGTGFSSFNIRQNTSLSSWNKTGITGTNATNLSSQSGIFSAQAPIAPSSSGKLIAIILLLVAILVGGSIFAYLKFIKNGNGEDKVNNNGRISLTTQPSGATVFINGKEHKEKTPTIIKDQPINEPIGVRIKKEGYQIVVKEIIIKDEKLHQEKVELIESTNKYGLVKVSSKPSGAVIYLDNKKLDKKTPSTLTEIPAGQHNILLELKGYDPYFTKFTLNPDELKDITTELFKEGTVKTGFITLELSTSGVVITIDGKNIQEPVKNYSVEPGKKIEVIVKKNGYETFKTTTTLKRGDHDLIKVNLKKKRTKINKHVNKNKSPGILNVKTLSGVDIYVDSKKEGTSSISNIKLKAGTHTIKLYSKSKMINYVTKVKIPSGGTVSKDFMLQKGKLAISVKPWANVYINGKKFGLTPISPKSLYEGTYTIKLVNPKFKPITKTVKVKPKKTELLMESFN